MDDGYFMGRALAAAREVEGKTGENPPVGCVVVKEQQVVALGATRPPGGPHAEVVAVAAAEEAGFNISDCDFYVTLEPCSFQGRTPPCALLLVARRPRRVIVGIRDPHPLVRGKGLEELQRAGIEVVEGVLADDISALLAPWVERFAHPA